MKNKRKIGLILGITILGMICCKSSYAIYDENEQTSKVYQGWLQLSEEERKEKIAPLSFNIDVVDKKGISNKFSQLVQDITIPKKYNLRDYFTIMTKDQKNTGECWAFSANTSVETTLKKHGETYDFSERHLEYETSLSFRDYRINPMAMDRLAESGRKFICCICILC